MPLAPDFDGDERPARIGHPLQRGADGRAFPLDVLLDLVQLHVRYDPKRAQIPTAAEVDALLAGAPARFRVAVVLAAGVGLRSGEARGLTVDRVDFLHRRLTVDRQLVTVLGGTRFGPPKSARSTRTVPLAAPVLEELARHVEAFPPDDDGLLVRDSSGRPLSRNRWSDVWRDIEAASGVHVRYHDLRHYHASVLLSAGVSVPMTATMLGHSPAELLKTYAHIIEGDDDRARDAIERAFANADSTRTVAASAHLTHLPASS